MTLKRYFLSTFFDVLFERSNYNENTPEWNWLISTHEKISNHISRKGWDTHIWELRKVSCTHFRQKCVQKCVQRVRARVKECVYVPMCVCARVWVCAPVCVYVCVCQTTISLSHINETCSMLELLTCNFFFEFLHFTRNRPFCYTVMGMFR